MEISLFQLFLKFPLRHTGRRRSPFRRRLCLFFAAFRFTALLFARDVEIAVEDADLGIALEGAAVRSWDGGESYCDGEGKVRLQVPDDRRVVIRVSYPGYENGSLLVPLEGDSFTVALRLGGIMENRELVIEAPRPGTSETKSGRSVALSGKELARTSEIGIVEDVMTSIKLLPGVGYTGSLGALPSIRGGEPGDLTAVLDGFYIERPYHWGGLFSIFDPKMIESARLSHGVFSARYGHTISGLLELSSRRAHPETAELELGLSTSAVNLSLSYPLNGRGGLMAMGRVTYWDPYVDLMKLFIDEVRYVRQAPYIRSAAFSGYYRFSGDLELNGSAFFGSDGIGISYDSTRRESEIRTDSSSRFDYYNLLGFLVTGLTFNPADNMVLKTSLGAGF
ncbi:MAG: TonB-dependent receptor plug domain-containing protein, partial [Treponema sp.]|nr:TonB-dependent receptor plug domain-containing protein [Treponema sp.]